MDTEKLAAVCARVDALLQTQPRVLLAIDGMSGAGKTVLASQLAQKYNANVFHMDDFFLRSEQRTAQRMAEIGGNVDRERFAAEVLTPLQNGVPFRYKPFACSTMQLAAQAVAVQPKQVEIVEGVYSHHPAFGSAYTLRVFCSITGKAQQANILRRSGAAKLERYNAEWIPLENAYFTAFHIPQKADMVLE